MYVQGDSEKCSDLVIQAVSFFSFQVAKPNQTTTAAEAKIVFCSKTTMLYLPWETALEWNNGISTSQQQLVISIVLLYYPNPNKKTTITGAKVDKLLPTGTDH